VGHVRYGKRAAGVVASHLQVTLSMLNETIYDANSIDHNCIDYDGLLKPFAEPRAL
jgi:hypothetical protein